MALITMMFTDVVESSATKRDTSLGRDNRERDHAYLTQVQTPHFELVRACCKAHGGREVSTMGDAFFLAFDDPAEAVRCAVNIQQRLTATPIQTPRGALRLRIGIHSGFPEFFEGSWHGTDVDTTARVEAAATERQILVSESTYEITRDMTDAKFHACGEFALKGVGSIALWDVDWDGHGPRRPAALPVEEFRRRRQRRMAAVAAMVLVAVGAGYAVRHYVKARETGEAIVPEKPRQSVAVLGFKNLGGAEEAWLADAVPEMLSTELGANDALRIVSPDDVSTTKADLAIAMVPIFNSATLLKIGRILHSQYVISGAYVAMGNQAGDSIHIDVHLQDADTGEAISSFGQDGTIANLSDVLRRAAENVRSRLGVQDQTPSANPQSKPALPSNPEALRDYSEGVARLRRFDALGARGLLESAIALEPNFALLHWAAARTWQLLGYDEKAREEAKKAMELLGDLPRWDQRTIEAENYELNGKWDQAVANYQALWVFYPDEPNYALALASAQTSAGKGQDALGTLAKLGSQPQMKDDPRVDLARAFAAESLSDVKLQQSAAAAAAEKASGLGSRYLAAQAYWQECSALFALGELPKAMEACQKSTAAAPFALEIEARTKTVEASILLAQGQAADALEMRRQALDTARKIGSQKDVTGALMNLANLMDMEGNSNEARKNYEDAIEIAREIGDKQQLATLQFDLGGQRFTQGDYAAAETLYRQSLQDAQEIGDSGGVAMAFQSLGLLSFQLGDLAEARKSIDEAIKISQVARLRSVQAPSLGNRGDIQMAQADLSGARKSYEDEARLFTLLGDQAGVASAHTSLARLSLEEGSASESEKLARQAVAELQEGNLVDYKADAGDALARALMAQGKLVDAQAQIDDAARISAQDRGVRMSIAITEAQLKARNGKMAEAQRNLDANLRDAIQLKLVGFQLEIALALAQLKEIADPKSASVELQTLSNEARKKGYLLIASKAARKQQLAAK
jgi:class 3 adenylate cyclase/tetratricopeptide (TPR) repeat protein